MDELDILKKHWKENQKFPKISQEELRSMIHKKSSSLVMWIFIISIFEFILLNVLSYALPINDTHTSARMEKLIDNFDYLSIGISLLFIYLFYNNYRKIKVYSSSKDLMSQIIKTKKTVNYYIYINIFIVICGVGYSFLQVFYDQSSDETPAMAAIIFIGLFVIMTLIITLVIWLFYKLVYGFLLKRLTKNLKELQKIDEE